MNTLLAETMIGRKFNFYRQICPIGAWEDLDPPPPGDKNPLRLMFSVYIALCIQSAGEVTWHRSLISIRGLSRLIDGSHFLLRHGEFSSPGWRDQ